MNRPKWKRSLSRTFAMRTFIKQGIPVYPVIMLCFLCSRSMGSLGRTWAVLPCSQWLLLVHVSMHFLGLEYWNFWRCAGGLLSIPCFAFVFEWLYWWFNHATSWQRIFWPNYCINSVHQQGWFAGSSRLCRFCFHRKLYTAVRIERFRCQVRQSFPARCWYLAFNGPEISLLCAHGDGETVRSDARWKVRAGYGSDWPFWACWLRKQAKYKCTFMV